MLIYILFEDLFVKKYIGVRNKIYSQIKVFSKCMETKVFLSFISYNMAYLYDEESLIEKDVIDYSEYYGCLLNWIRKYRINGLYIRYRIPACPQFINFLKKCDSYNIKVIVEFPTFPYDLETRDSYLLSIDKFFRHKLCKYIRLATTYSRIDDIFGIPVSVLQNGVDIEKNRLHKRKRHGNIINMLAVANFAPRHGYERVVEGMGVYYKNANVKYNINLLLVGTEGQNDIYMSIARKYNIEQHVIYLGIKEGKELDTVYDNADIGISILGFYKLGIKNAAPIKTREYCARGLPFVYGYDDIGFVGNERFLLKVENSESPINMRRIISLYEKTVDNNMICEEMYEYTKKNFTWDVILRDVIAYYKE